jgi:DNA-binding LacI/PurR family transcriptional regulator
MTASRRGRRATSADVAREAGVSRATVSYVLNDTPHQTIPEPTRQRVLRAAARLGYTPSAAARVLSSGRSDIVLLLMPDWPIGPGVGRFIEQLSARLTEAGFTMVAHPRAQTPRPVSELWKAITPAAVVCWEELDDGEVEAMTSAGIDVTVVLLGRTRRHSFELEVSQQHVGRLQVEHLAAAGHRRLGYAWPDDERVLSFARPRLDGVRQGCADLGLVDPVLQTVPLEPRSAAEAVARWRDADEPVTAVCAYNDEIALAVLAGMRLLGLAAPDDIAVVGVDDIPAAALAVPPLSTVKVADEALARYVADRLVHSLTGRPEPPSPGSDIVSVLQRESG